jgi:threonine/homoserine/homoserine lactone efflux protein
MPLYVNTFAPEIKDMEAIAKGILSGIGYGLLIGPLFFLSVRVILGHGLQHGLALIAGAFTSDCMLVMTSWWGAGKLEAISTDPGFQNWIGLFSGLLLLGFGISAVWPRKKELALKMEGAVKIAKRRYSYLQGILINSTNPSNWLFWLSIATVAKSDDSSKEELFARLFMGAALVTLFCTDLIKAYVAHRIGSKLKPGMTEKIVRVAGIVLICLSSWVLFSVVQDWNTI